MSLRDRTNVAELVKKYKQKYPSLDRDLLRKLIRIENNIKDTSQLRKLDRYLKKEFENAKHKPESEAAPTLTDKEIPFLIYAKIRSKKSRVWKEIYDAYMELKQEKLK